MVGGCWDEFWSQGAWEGDSAPLSFGEGYFSLPLVGPQERGGAAHCMSQAVYLGSLHWIKEGTLHVKPPPLSWGRAEPLPP